MRSRFLLTTLALLAVISDASFSHFDAASETRAAIQAQYDKINAMVQHKDVKGIPALYTPDYEFVSVRGEKMTLKDLEKGLAQLAHASGIHGKTVVRSVKLAGGKAIVQIEDTSGFSAPLPGEPPRTALYASVSTAEDVWIKGAHGWQLSRTHQLTDRRTINGVAVKDELPLKTPPARKR